MQTTSGPRIEPRTSGHSDASINLFRTLGKNRGIYKPFLGMLSHLMNDGVLPAREREIVVLRVGFQCRSEYEFGQHVQIGRDAGLTDEEIASLGSAGGLSRDGDAALVAMADELCSRDVVSEATWMALARRWSEEQLIELLMLSGFYRMVSGFLNTVQVAPDGPDIAWPAAVAERIEGEA